MARTKVFDTNTHSWVYADKSFGKDGKSAYEYAKDAGYTGSEEEFAAKLAATDTSELTRENIIDALGYTPLESYTLPAAGSSLGGVKSGGDVTISSGVITVKDDSHNHIIANIDNLGATLNGKADKSEGAFYIEGSGTTDATAKTSTWVGTSDRITDYYDGLTIRYKIGIEGQSTVTLNINNLGAKTVYRFDTTKLTTHFPVGSIIHLIYHEDLNDGCWISNDYDANTDTQQRVYATTTDKEYPITARYNNTTGETYYAEYGRYTTGVTLNPSTKTITATAFKGKLTGNADTATKATQDASGNVITTTYETKANVTTKLTEVNNQIAQLSEEKVTKSGLTLGVHTDGLVYLFVDGVPHGNGLDIKADVVGDIFGYVDENNIIILNGTLTNGTYTIKYEMADGSVIEIGDLELDSNKGNLADPTSADWLTDKRLAMAYGYTKDSVGNIFTNYIPVKSGDVIRVKGLNLYGVQNGVSSAIACYSSNTDTSTDSDGALNAYTGGVYTAVTTELEENGVRDQVSQDGNIFTYTILVYNDGTQMADPETAYIRISAPLLEGYTAEEVIITVNEAIPEDNTYWFITNNLTNCKTSNTATRVVKGESYAATITAKDGYSLSTVRITMGGNYIPVNNGVINIETVTGDIVITAIAEVPKGNLADPTSADWQEDYRLSISSGTVSAQAGHTTTNYIACKVGDVLRIKGMRITGTDGNGTETANTAKLVVYNVNKNKLGGLFGVMTVNSDAYGNQVIVNGDISEYTLFMRNDDTQTSRQNIAYVRFDGFLLDGYTKEDVIITINEVIEDEDITKYSITNNLTNCTNSNSATTVNEGSAYSATITANAGYTIKSVTATMGGSAVTVNNGVINIASVTGDIVITAVAEEVDTGEPVNLAQTDSTNKTDISIWCNDARLGSDFGHRALAGNIVTNYFSCEIGDIVYVKGLTIDTTTSSMTNSLSFYDSSKNGLSVSNAQYYLGQNDYIDLSSDANYPYIFDTTKLGNYAQAIGTKFMRISATLSGSLSDVVINVKRNGVWVTTNGSDGSDGSGSDSGDTGSSSSYTNLLPSAIDTDGTPYGDGKGYISGYKLSCSSAGGTPSATSGAYVSGFMPINNNTDTLRIKNVTLHANANVNNIIFYNKDKTKLYGVAGLAGSFAALIRVDDGNVYRCRPGAWLSNTTAANIGFFRFSCGGITDETIVTVNEEIV